jgi:opacity protein-like surface antigen
MRKTSVIFVALLAVAKAAAAQTTAPQPRFEMAVTAGVIEASPGERPAYYDNWYAQGRYAGSIGYYFTKHVKAEFEHAWSGEASRYLIDYAPINGSPYPYQVEEFFQLQQSTLRVVWQFGDNAWVHPYLGAGAVVDTEHQRSHVPVTFQIGPRGERVPVIKSDSDDRTKIRAGVSLSGGAKIYVSPRAFINTAAIVTFSKPARSVNLIAGFGVDF